MLRVEIRSVRRWSRVWRSENGSFDPRVVRGCKLRRRFCKTLFSDGVRSCFECRILEKHRVSGRGRLSFLRGRIRLCLRAYEGGGQRRPGTNSHALSFSLVQSAYRRNRAGFVDYEIERTAVVLRAAVYRRAVHGFSKRHIARGAVHKISLKTRTTPNHAPLIIKRSYRAQHVFSSVAGFELGRFRCKDRSDLGLRFFA